MGRCPGDSKSPGLNTQESEDTMKSRRWWMMCTLTIVVGFVPVIGQSALGPNPAAMANVVSTDPGGTGTFRTSIPTDREVIQ